MAMVKIRAKKDNLTTLNATLMKGDVGECPESRAKVLVGRGEAEFVEGDTELRPIKGDATERAVNPARDATERQIKKG